MKSICVFCGSSLGVSKTYRQEASALGVRLARRNIQLVYGGANVGLMGCVANACLAEGGTVIGVMPRHLAEMEVAHDHLTQLHIVEDMHERKRLMNQLSDGFITLPGGIGTLDETFELFTWLQLGLHSKPLGLLDIGDYYGSLIEFLTRMVTEGFLLRQHMDMLIVDQDADTLLNRMNEFKPQHCEKWFDRKKNAAHLN